MAVDYTGLSNLKGDNFGGIGYAYNNSWIFIQSGLRHRHHQVHRRHRCRQRERQQSKSTSAVPTGTLAGTLHTTVTGAWNNYAAQSTAVAGLTGVQTVYLVFKGPVAGVSNIDWLQFS